MLCQNNISPAGACHGNYVHAYDNPQVLVVKLTRSHFVPYLFPPMEMHKLLLPKKKSIPIC